MDRGSISACTRIIDDNKGKAPEKTSADLNVDDDMSGHVTVRPYDIPAHISLRAPVTKPHTIPFDYMDHATIGIKDPSFVTWYINTMNLPCRQCKEKGHTCVPPVIDKSVQRKFKCSACQGTSQKCSWAADLKETYIREAYQLDVGEARSLATSHDKLPNTTLSTFYRTWLDDPAARHIDDEMREQLHEIQQLERNSPSANHIVSQKHIPKPRRQSKRRRRIFDTDSESTAEGAIIVGTPREVPMQLSTSAQSTSHRVRSSSHPEAPPASSPPVRSKKSKINSTMHPTGTSTSSQMSDPDKLMIRIQRHPTVAQLSSHGICTTLPPARSKSPSSSAVAANAPVIVGSCPPQCDSPMDPPTPAMHPPSPVPVPASAVTPSPAPTSAVYPPRLTPAPVPPVVPTTTVRQLPAAAHGDNQSHSPVNNGDTDYQIHGLSALPASISQFILEDPDFERKFPDRGDAEVHWVEVARGLVLARSFLRTLISNTFSRYREAQGRIQELESENDKLRSILALQTAMHEEVVALRAASTVSQRRIQELDVNNEQLRQSLLTAQSSLKSAQDEIAAYCLESKQLKKALEDSALTADDLNGLLSNIISLTSRNASPSARLLLDSLGQRFRGASQ